MLPPVSVEEFVGLLNIRTIHISARCETGILRESLRGVVVCSVLVPVFLRHALAGLRAGLKTGNRTRPRTPYSQFSVFCGTAAI